MKQKQATWGAIPIKLLSDRRLSLNDLRVYCALSSFIGTKNDCFPRLTQIGERSGIRNVSRVSKHLHRLCAFGLIEITRRGKRISNTYRLRTGELPQIDNSPSENERSELSESDRGELPQSDNSDSPQGDKSNIKTSSKTKIRTTPEEEFIFNDEQLKITRQQLTDYQTAFPAIQLSRGRFYKAFVECSQIMRQMKQRGETIHSPVSFLHAFLERRERAQRGETVPADHSGYTGRRTGKALSLREILTPLGRLELQTEPRDPS